MRGNISFVLNKLHNRNRKCHPRVELLSRGPFLVNSVMPEAPGMNSFETERIKEALQNTRKMNDRNCQSQSRPNKKSRSRFEKADVRYVE